MLVDGLVLGAMERLLASF